MTKVLVQIGDVLIDPTAVLALVPGETDGETVVVFSGTSAQVVVRALPGEIVEHMRSALT